MESTEIDNLEAWSIQRVSRVSVAFKRYLWEQINWNNQLNIIVGARGVGKTTLLLQYLQEQFPPGGPALYASLDHLFFSRHTLVDLAEAFAQRGGKLLALDEVHKYPSWSREVKLIYDQFPALQLLVSGSSTTEILRGEGDLSRRGRIYHLRGLSFREYLHFAEGQHFPPVTLQEVLAKAIPLSLEISQKVRPIQFFEPYLNHGYYPFFKEDPEGYAERLRQVVNVVIESDIPAVFKVDYGAALNIKKLLGLLSEMMPFKPNVQKLSRQLGLSRETLIKYLQYLGRADLLQLLYSEAKGVSLLNKPEKLYLQNPNLAYALAKGSALNRGSLRETFFLNQAGAVHEVRYPRKAGDFLVDQNYLFEVGGAGKSTAQIRSAENAWVVSDNMEVATAHRLPLWLFGFLY